MLPTKKAWVVSTNMGYGHDRAAYGLEELAYGDIISANDYDGIPAKEKRYWDTTRHAYERISRLQPIPVIGQGIFELMNSFQIIPDFYPRRNLIDPVFQTKQTYYAIRKLGIGKHLVQQLNKRKLPLVCTFFNFAFAAEEHGYAEDIYLTICDADISRAWAPEDPKKSKIKYLAPNGRVVERLKLYGVKPEQIFLTGFPLPKTLIGGADAKTAKQDLMARICNLDPKGIFIKKYHKTLEQSLGIKTCVPKHKHPLTLTFCVGGAGAQSQIGIQLMESLRSKIHNKEIRLNLEVGTRESMAKQYLEAVEHLHLTSSLGKSLFVNWYSDRPSYFHQFAKSLRTTDILWTKPSELSFYCGLGLPIIMAPTIGSQEDFNKMWLETVGAGTSQLDPRYADEWLFDWIESGGLARFAWNGYIEAPTHGAYRVENIVSGTNTVVEDLPLIV